jgi:hypothetical protein
MLIFRANDGENNIIQLVVGPETRFQLSMMGVIKVDLANLIDGFDTATPLKLVITATDSEHKTMEALNVTDGSPPFPPEFFKSGRDMGREPIGEPPIHEGVAEPESAEYYHEDPRGQYVEEIKCPGCKSLGVYLKANMPPYCADCLKIELGLGNIDESSDDEEVEEEEPKSKGFRKLTGPTNNTE